MMPIENQKCSAVHIQNSSQQISYRILDEAECSAWDHFVSEHPDSSIYHLSIWRHILGKAFGKSWYVVVALERDKVIGGVPVVHMKSRLFGNFLVSIPYFNYGGLLYQDRSLVDPILREVHMLGKQLGVKYVEFRHLKDHGIELPSRSEKVSMWLTLPDTAEKLLKSFKPKLRSQVRKGEKNGLMVQCGGGELLDDFYSVFCRNMRDLGTPVYGKEIFQLILEAFPKSARLIVVTDRSKQAVAAGFLLGYHNRLEIPWASSLREYNHLQSNMFMYWNCLKYACDQGYPIFDFGRSSVGSSTFKFKEQWGAQPVPHYWHYYLNGRRTMPQLNPQNAKFHLAISIWKRLPVPLTRLLGPSIAKHLP